MRVPARSTFPRSSRLCPSTAFSDRIPFSLREWLLGSGLVGGFLLAITGLNDCRQYVVSLVYFEEESDGGETNGTGGHGRSLYLKPVVMDGLQTGVDGKADGSHKA